MHCIIMRTWTLALFASLHLSLLSGPPAARAESGDGAPMIELGVGGLQAGARQSWGPCPCFRWTVGVELVSGGIETRDFLISTEALFRMDETRTLDYLNSTTSRLYTVGAIEALWTGGLGLKFDGVTFGHDHDRSYADVLRSGLHLMFNIVRSEAIRLDLRSGYEFEQFRVNLSPNPTEVHTLPQSLFLEWNAGIASGILGATVALNAADLFEPSLFNLRADAKVDFRVLSRGGVNLHLGLDASAERDAFRELLELAPHNVTAGLYMRMSYVPVHERTGNAPHVGGY